MSPIKIFALIVVSALAAGPLFAAESEAEKAPAAAVAAPPDPIKISTQHRLKSGGTDIAYTATAEEIYLRDS